MTCNCNSLPNYFEVSKNHQGFVSTLKLIDAKDFVRFEQCPNCNQLWAIDEWDKYVDQFAIKISSIDSWQNFDRSVLGKLYLIKSRGGLTNEKCIWAGCTGKRVKGVAHCVDHLYKTGVRK